MLQVVVIQHLYHPSQIYITYTLLMTEQIIRISKLSKVMKMKNKLGTRQLPTAELLLDGCRAEMVGEEGKGVANISNMLTITRLHNTLAAVSAMR